MNLFFKNKDRREKHGDFVRSAIAGFTLFEMLVSIAIFTFLAAVLFVKNSQFEGTTVLTNIAYELALDVRQAQTYGLDVRAPGVSTASSDFEHAYGIDFTISTDPVVSHTFTLFADGDSNYIFDNPGMSGGDIVVQTTLLPPQYSVVRVDGIGNDSNAYCSDMANTHGLQLSAIDISFKRPQPNANIYGSLVSRGSPVAMQSANIYLQSATGLYREIQVNLAGQISVNESPTAPAVGTNCNGL